MKIQASNLHGRGGRLLPLLAAALLTLAVVGLPRIGEARLDPFYIVHGQSYGTVVPRVVFVLDNSGSMAMDQTYKPNANYPNTKCWWANCEDENAGMLQSRVHAARQVIAELATANKDRAEFALMTFGTALPPASANEVPEPCKRQPGNKELRFTWVTTVNQPYSNIWKPVSNVFGEQGIWVLCGDNRPFPYLRHDDLGGFSLPNHSQETLLDEPLYKQKSTAGAYADDDNHERKVQWFPRFVGRRANFDCSDENQEAVVLDSWGDWGNNNGTKKSQVCDHDFYYWPYVDGNPGYSYYSGKSVDNTKHQECDDNAQCKDKTDDIHRLGVTRRDQWVGASLYAPFYAKSVIDDPNIAPEDKGPLSEDDAWTMFAGATDKMYAGGADVTGGTPMAVAMGVTEYLVHTDNQGNLLGPKPALPQTNRPFAHDTVASYLAFMRLVDEDALCKPVTMIIVTDGQPDPWNKQGGAKLYERLRSVRRILSVKTYVIAYTSEVWSDPLSWERTHEIACAAAGANSIPTPCAGDNDYGWDTCADKEDPANGCAWLANNKEELSATLTHIVNQTIETAVPGGAPTVANDFQMADPNDPEAAQAAMQTTISSWTQSPSWTGHVVRGACTDEDPDNPGQLADYCLNAAELPVETEELESFGPCPLARVWDAGACLQQTAPSERRLFTHGFDNQPIRIAVDGEPTPAFIDLISTLDQQGKIDPPLTPGNEDAEIQAMVGFLLGEDLPEDWKLPGLSNSAPILIRRVPKQDAKFLPSVGIRDPHCAGRRNVQGDNIPDSLQAFASQAWETSAGGGFNTHYDYAEAVLIGDDFGVLHAFHYDSGNELFGFVPLALLNNSRVLSLNGPERFGQPEALEDHIFGVASTVNAGWIFDETTQQWRHLAVFGLGPGGADLLALDVSHMARLQDDDPIDVLWTSTTAAIADDYADTLGQTWSRPALTYAVPNDEMSLTPKSYLVFGSGYREGEGDDRRGRVLWMVDAATGETVTAKALLPTPPAGTSFDAEADIAAVGDVAVGSHCLSRYWGEMQEAYIADPAGRLFRWDLAADLSNVTSFPHVADSGGTWPLSDGFAMASEAFRFPACQGDGAYSCTINPIAQNGNKGDVFNFSPAVVANHRIDDIDDPGETLPLGARDQFLIALASGSPNDDAIDGGDSDNDFHSSIYLLVDDHRQDPAGGLDIPANAPVTEPGSHNHFMRLPLNQITRTRRIVFPDDSVEEQTRPFSKSARPIRAPMIKVTGLAKDGQQLDAEVFYVTYTIYEPGDSTCDSRWYDEETKEWVFDRGATYEVSFRLVVGAAGAFDFQSNFMLSADYGDGFGTAGSLAAPKVEQVGGCDDGNCGAVLEAPKTSPCDPNLNAPPLGGMTSIQTGSGELDGFSPLEIAL